MKKIRAKCCWPKVQEELIKLYTGEYLAVTDNDGEIIYF
jgi:hypothetical protein